MIFLKNYFVDTTEEVDVVSVIHEINYAIKDSTIQEGLVTVVVTEPGAAVTILEPLPDIVAQFKDTLEIFPGEGETLSRRKESIPVAPRIKAAMLGKTVHIPCKDGKLVLGPREEVVLVDFEKSAKRREFYVQVMGETPVQPGGGRQQQRR
jgi:secondary thiamine-phosphate synthase enzyme